MLVIWLKFIGANNLYIILFLKLFFYLHLNKFIQINIILLKSYAMEKHNLCHKTCTKNNTMHLYKIKPNAQELMINFEAKSKSREVSIYARSWQSWCIVWKSICSYAVCYVLAYHIYLHSCIVGYPSFIYHHIFLVDEYSSFFFFFPYFPLYFLYHFSSLKYHKQKEKSIFFFRWSKCRLEF